ALILQSTQLGVDGAINLAWSLRSTPRLQTLSLDSNAMDDEGALAILRELPSLQHLTSLSLKANNLTGATAEVLAPLLRQWPELRWLYLRDNALGLPGVQLLVECIKLHAPQMSHCSVGNNGLTYAEMQRVSSFVDGIFLY